MISPSVRSTSRSTPWVLGCCGPMLTSISSVRTSNSITVGSSGGMCAPGERGRNLLLLAQERLVHEERIGVRPPADFVPVGGQVLGALGVVLERAGDERVHADHLRPEPLQVELLEDRELQPLDVDRKEIRAF